MKARSYAVERVCGVLGMRRDRWPTDWPPATGRQVVVLRALRKARPNSFVAAVDIHTGIYRVIVLDDNRGRRPHAREYALLLDGRMRRVQAGVPYTEEEARHVA